MRKKTKLIMLAGAAVAGIGALCMVNKKLACTDAEEDDLGINDIFSNCKAMFDKVPAATLDAIYRDRERLYTVLGQMAYLGYDKDRDVVEARIIDDEDDTLIELYVLDGEVRWRITGC